MRAADIVDVQGIAEIFDVKIKTVHAWRLRDLLPPPLKMVSGVPIWARTSILTWGKETGRKAVNPNAG
jgi:hypothetical protein